MTDSKASSPVFVIMAGGTGGHIFPALAVADELRDQGFRIHWLGTRDGMEAELVPKHGYDISFMPVKGVRGNGLKALLQAPFRVLVSIWHAMKVLREQKAVAVLGMGGFVAGPGSVAAWLQRRPLVLHEQNAILGLTNKIASYFSTRVLEAFPGAFPAAKKATCTGNPVRSVIRASGDSESTIGALKILVLGGSRGAVSINSLVPEALSQLKDTELEVWHQTGARNDLETKTFYMKAGVEGRIDPFIDDMAEAYAWADLVLCRSGALTVAELANAGKPSILVPYPWHKDQQQLHNARYLIDNGAAILLEQNTMDAVTLAGMFKRLSDDRDQLQTMSRAAAGCAHPDATKAVARICREVANV